jgi:signal peptidase II
MPDIASSVRRRRRAIHLPSDDITLMDKSPNTKPRGRSAGYILVLILTGAVLLILDIVTKYLIQTDFVPGESVPVIGDFVRFTYILNPKGAFGVSVGSNGFHIFTSFVVIAVVVYVFWKGLGASKLIDFSLAAILSGAIGNLIDRIRFGTVIDFVDVDFFNIKFGDLYMTRWPVFNVADAAITVGMVIVIVLLIFNRQGSGDECKKDRGIEGESS